MKQLRLLQVRTVAKSSSETSKFNAWQVLLQCTAQLIKTTLEIMWRAPQIPVHSSSSSTQCWKDQDPCCCQAAPPKECQPQFTAATAAGMCQEPEVLPGLPAPTTPLGSQYHTGSCKHLLPAHPLRWTHQSHRLKMKTPDLGGREVLLLNERTYRDSKQCEVKPPKGLSWHWN